MGAAQPEADGSRPPCPGAGVRCIVALLALGACQCARLVQAYECEGAGCCDAECVSGDDCRLTAAGVKVPRWWPKDSCDEKVAEEYDPDIPCSRALQPFEPCGTGEDFACGYGLACVAESITYAQCAPICGRAFHDEFLHLKGVAAGCKVDGQHGAVNHDAAGEVIPVGKVVQTPDGIAVPECIAAANLATVGAQQQADGASTDVDSGDGGPTAVTQVAPQDRREKLAGQLIGLNLLFFEVWPMSAFPHCPWRMA
jgi:hypothetical protein